MQHEITMASLSHPCSSLSINKRGKRFPASNLLQYDVGDRGSINSDKHHLHTFDKSDPNCQASFPPPPHIKHVSNC